MAVERGSAGSSLLAIRVFTISWRRRPGATWQDSPQRPRRRITEAHEDLTTLEEARTRIAARSEEIRRRITADLQKDIEQTYRALLQQLTTHFAALRPINDHLLELRHRHYQTSTLLMHVPSWGELSPNVVNGVPSKMAAWLAHAPPRLHVCVRAFKKFNFGRLTQITRMDGAERKEVC